MADKTFHSITLPGTDTARVPLTAVEFSTSTAYKVRDYCTHEGKLYICKTAHAAGAWNSAHFTEVNVGDEINTRLIIPPTTQPASTNRRVGDLWIDVNTDSPIISIDPQPTVGSTNVPQSGGTFNLIKNLDNNKAGKSLLTGDFSPTSPYFVNDLCIHNGYLYRCKVDIPTGTTWDASKWQATTIQTELARIESEEVNLGVIAETFGDSNSYAVGDYVLHTENGTDKLYRCINAVSDTSVWNSQYWSEVKLADEVSDLKSAITEQTRNLWPLKSGYSGKGTVDDLGVWYLELPESYPAGTYTISMSIESDDTFSDKCMIGIYKLGPSWANTYRLAVTTVSRGTRQPFTFTVEEPFQRVMICSSNSSAQSVGDTSTVTEIQLETGSTMSDYIPHLSARDAILRVLVDKTRNEMFASGNLTISASNVSQYPSMDRMPINQSINILTNAVSSITDYPFNNGGYVYTLSAYEGNRDVQIVIPTINQAGTMAIRQKNNNTWGSWKKIPPFGCGDTGTNQYNDIYTALSNSKVIILPPGDYIVNNTIFMPDGATIRGCGRSTRIIAGESLTGPVIRMRTNNTVSDLAILGSTTEFTPDGATNDTCGILISGTGISDETQRRNALSNVEIANFSGSGITIKDTGLGVASGILCENCFIHHCNIGINIPQLGEFNSFTNCNIDYNYIGIYNNGGNNYFNNCSISKNTSIGLKMYNIKDPTTQEDSAYNNSHGTFSGCVFAHTGVDNAHPGYAIDIEGMTHSEMFVGCQIGYGYTRIKNCFGIHFVSCNYTSRVNIEIDQSGNEDGKGAVIFLGCNSQGVNEPPLTVTPENASGVHFVNCYNRNGLLVTRYP